MRLIFISGKAGSGKTTLANCMTFYPENVLSLADPVKAVAKDFAGWNGEKDEEGRKLLVFIGEILGKELTQYVDLSNINEYFIWDNGKTADQYTTLDWHKLYYNLISSFTPDKLFWVRYLYEKYLKSKAASIFPKNIVTIRINKKDEAKLEYPNESELDKFPFDIVLENNGSIADLTSKIHMKLGRSLTSDDFIISDWRRLKELAFLKYVFKAY